MTFDRIRKIGAAKNMPLMEIYHSVSPSELAFWNKHVVVNHKNIVPGVTDQEVVFSGSGVEAKVGHPGVDAPVGDQVHSAPVREDTELTEDDLALSRLRVRRAKLRKKLKSKPDDVPMNMLMLSLEKQISNLHRAQKTRDAWAQNAERDS